MPLPIELDLNHWVRIVPAEGKTQTVKALGGACYYSGEATPPELESPGKPASGTELAENSTTVLEAPGKWFIQKIAAAGAAQKPVILEKSAGNPESVGASELAPEAVTAAKIAKEAVTATKGLPATTPTPSGTESLTAELGTAGVTRTVVAAYNAKAEASAKVKIKHGLKTEGVIVFAYTAATKKPSERLPDSATVKGAIAKIKIESAEEILVTLGSEAPAGKEEFFYVVMG